MIRPSRGQETGVEIVGGAIDIEIAARKNRGEQCRAEFGRRSKQLVYISVLGPTQYRQRAAERKILWIERTAMRRVEHQGYSVGSRIAPPQHPGNLVAAFGFAHSPALAVCA